MSLNSISILCFDGDVIPAGDPPAGDDLMFSQADLNKILAHDKRKHQERYAQLETEHSELLQNQNLTEEERNKLNGRIADLQAAQRTKEQQIEFDRKQSEGEHTVALKESQDRGNHWEDLYKKETVARSLIDAAASGDAYSPSQIVDFLEPKTELKEIEGKLVPMVDFPDIDEHGEAVQVLCSPADAVQRMRKLPKHGNLFKSNIVSGVGAGQGVAPQGIDHRSIDPATYRKNRAAIIKQVSER